MTGIGFGQVTLTDIGAANPTPGPNDIAQLSTNGNTAATLPRQAGLNYYTDNAAPPGQTFTTGTNSTNLIALAIRTGWSGFRWRIRDSFDHPQLLSANLLGVRQHRDINQN